MRDIYVKANSVHMNDKCGVIKPDHDADFVVLDDDMTVEETYLNGVSRYQR